MDSKLSELLVLLKNSKDNLETLEQSTTPMSSSFILESLNRDLDKAIKLVEQVRNG